MLPIKTDIRPVWIITTLILLFLFQIGPAEKHELQTNECTYLFIWEPSFLYILQFKIACATSWIYIYTVQRKTTTDLSNSPDFFRPTTFEVRMFRSKSFRRMCVRSSEYAHFEDISITSDAYYQRPLRIVRTRTTFSSHGSVFHQLNVITPWQ